MTCKNPDCDRNKLVDPPLPCRCVAFVHVPDMTPPPATMYFVPKGSEWHVNYGDGWKRVV
jgi:hypothetical protein